MISGNKTFIRRAVCLWIGMIGLLLLVPPVSTVHAGFVDRIKDIYGMPEQLGQLQEQYNNTKQALEENRAQLEETLKRSEEAAQRYQETEERLRQENEQLRARNERLEELIGKWEAAERAQERRTRQIVTTAMTAAGLVLFYFVLTRLVRVAVWRRNRNG